jgi:hypothetical protein
VIVAVNNGRRIPVEPIQWTASGRVQVKASTSPWSGRFYPVPSLCLRHTDGATALSEVLAALPTEEAQ